MEQIKYSDIPWKVYEGQGCTDVAFRIDSLRTQFAIQRVSKNIHTGISFYMMLDDLEHTECIREESFHPDDPDIETKIERFVMEIIGSFNPDAIKWVVENSEDD